MFLTIIFLVSKTNQYKGKINKTKNLYENALKIQTIAKLTRENKYLSYAEFDICICTPRQ